MYTNLKLSDIYLSEIESFEGDAPISRIARHLLSHDQNIALLRSGSDSVKAITLQCIVSILVDCESLGQPSNTLKACDVITLPDETLCIEAYNLTNKYPAKLFISKSPTGYRFIEPANLVVHLFEYYETHPIGKELLKIQNRLNQAQQIAKIGSWEYDFTKDTLWWSKQIYTMFELSPDRYTPSYEGFLDAVHPDDRERVDTAFRKSLELKVDYTITHRLKMNDGQIKHVHEQAQIVLDANGEVQHLHGTVQDVTEITEANQQLVLASSLFTFTSEPSVITDREGMIITVNDAFVKLLGYDKSEVEGVNPYTFLSRAPSKNGIKDIVGSVSTEGQWTGEVWLRRKNGTAFPALGYINSVYDESGRLQSFVATCSDITEIKNSQEILSHLDHHDALTGLPNRKLLHDRIDKAIDHARRNESPMAVIHLNVDGFKRINQDHGHFTADKLLKRIATELSSLLRSDDTVSRIGCDEFILLLDDIRSNEDASIVAEKVISNAKKPFVIDQKDIYASYSIGISTYPGDGNDTPTLLSRADEAMKRAQSQGRNTYQFYEPEMTRFTQNRSLILHDLHVAARANQFYLEYQPQVNNLNGELIGLEALIRWGHPEIGLIRPDQFISLAENNGLIIEIGNWVLREVFRQGAEWLSEGVEYKKLSINVSGPQLLRGTLPQQIVDLRNEFHFDLARLEIEVTETFAMQEFKHVLPQLRALTDMGLTLAIDDFGTGYSSLSKLKHMPVQLLKIDREFIKDIPDEDDCAITTAIIHLAKAMKMDIIAEGVETKEQANFLLSEGCALAQGFYYSKPLKAADVRGYIDAC
ncbi:putative bifunctional diguanylate cyclase/phosphodiesterase [Neptuniibacter sp. QD37_11]|uniref:putative bifunctional diguanylate cyclase/phosphodiesterase n=1 Tax=Neptuniibacter sp. QD37_11 TaxID=3398209 RepID=UPI0039F60D7B